MLAFEQILSWINKTCFKMTQRHSLFKNKEIRPLMSLLIIISALFVTAFFKITLRRLSYSLYQENKKFDQIQDKYYFRLKVYGRLNRTKRLENLARQNFLEKKQKGQIIQVIDGKALVID